MNPSCRLVFSRFPLSSVYSIVKVFLFVVTAAFQGFAPPCFVCFMIKRNRVCIPAMKFQRELFALISYSSWCIPDRDDVFALFQISGDIYGLHQKDAVSGSFVENAWR